MKVLKVAKTCSPEHLVRKNKEIVRKRRPINFSMKDLEDDESGDDTWNLVPQPYVDRVHNKIRPPKFHCIICNNRFSSKQYLNIHVANIHGNSKPNDVSYVCE